MRTLFGCNDTVETIKTVEKVKLVKKAQPHTGRSQLILLYWLFFFSTNVNIYIYFYCRKHRYIKAHRCFFFSFTTVIIIRVHFLFYFMVLLFKLFRKFCRRNTNLPLGAEVNQQLLLSFRLNVGIFCMELFCFGA